jgi:hypothetical protein
MVTVVLDFLPHVLHRNDNRFSGLGGRIYKFSHQILFLLKDKNQNSGRRPAFLKKSAAGRNASRCGGWFYHY